MKQQPEALRLADDLTKYLGGNTATQAAAELRRLYEAHDWQHKMAGERLRRIEKLETANAELLGALMDIVYGLESARIWGGMEWSYNPLHPFKYLPLRDKARAVIEKHGGQA